MQTEEEHVLVSDTAPDTAAEKAGLAEPEESRSITLEGAAAEEKGATREEREAHTQARITELRAKVDEIIALSGGDVPPEIEAARHDLMADPKSIDPQKLDHIDRTVQEKSAQQNQQLAMGAVLPIAILGAVLQEGKALNGSSVTSDYRDIPPEALNTPDIQHGVENAPMPARTLDEILR